MRRSFTGSSSIGVILTLLAVACSSDNDIAGPDPEPAGPPAERVESAIRLRVDMKAGKVTAERPSLVEGGATGEGLRPSFALLGDNEISATTANWEQSAVGEFTRNRVRVTFDLTVTNNLENSDLDPSTFPAPPVDEVVAFPFATEPAGLFGWKVRASPDWDLAPHDFFNDGLCLGLPTPPADCFRSEAFGASLQAGSSATRRVGFDIDPSVTSFTVDVAVAADIDEQPTTGTGTIEGAVSSTLFGPLEGAIITASPGGQSTTSNANGAYLLTDLAVGTHSITVTGTPASCFRASTTQVAVEARLTARADFALRCRRIAFTSTRDGSPNIYVMNADGTGLTRLTDHASRDTDPTWSPDGEKLAFASIRDGESEIYVMNADGTEQQVLTDIELTTGEELRTTHGQPAWSPDGSRIAFTNTVNVPPHIGSSIWVIGADGSGTNGIPNMPGSTQAAWYPDGSRIAFSALSASSAQTEVGAIDLDGSNRAQLTFTFFGLGNKSDPAWSPDGSTLAFTDLRASREIHVMDAAGRVVQLTHSPLESFGINNQAAWSPDGSKIAFVSIRDGNSEIYVMNADGTNQIRLTNNPAGDTEPAW